MRMNAGLIVPSLFYNEVGFRMLLLLGFYFLSYEKLTCCVTHSLLTD